MMFGTIKKSGDFWRYLANFTPVFPEFAIAKYRLGPLLSRAIACTKFAMLLWAIAYT